MVREMAGGTARLLQPSAPTSSSRKVGPPRLQDGVPHQTTAQTAGLQPTRRRAGLGAGESAPPSRAPAPPPREGRFSSEEPRLRPQLDPDRDLTAEAQPARPIARRPPPSRPRRTQVQPATPRPPRRAPPGAVGEGAASHLPALAPTALRAMAWLLTVTLGCISLLYLQLPGTLSRGLAGGQRPARPREPPAWTPSSGPQPRYPAPRPMVWKLHQALQPQRSNSLAPAMGQSLRGGPHRHLGPHRPRAQLLRVGCVLGTCQVQNLSHRLWQLVGSAGPRDSAPVDPSSPHSYG
ncbi:protein ADM2 isoform X1 [Equus przewalskii]|uniref:Protein ADM2 isoform X1 n=2 Tax=Equus przewalskii TaxID=9798 RepID=A0ABM4MRV9_EQUPR